MERVVPILGQYPDAGSLCTMVLEAVLVLLDPEICLNPMAQAKQRVADETPSPAEVSICCAFGTPGLRDKAGQVIPSKRAC